MKKADKLPRHTILASTGARFGAAIIDIAIFFLGFLILFLSASSPIFSNLVLKDTYNTLLKYEVDSHLVYLNEETNTYEVYTSADDYSVYETAIRYFYLNYLTGEGIADEDVKAPNYNVEMENEDGTKMLPKDYYTVSWYNYNILGITRDDPDAELSSCYFTYQKDTNGEYDKTLVGIPRTHRYNKDKDAVVDLTNVDIAGYIKPFYQKSYTHLTAQSFYAPLARESTFYSGVSALIPMTISGIIFYIVIPLIRKDGATLGKLFFKLGLAHMNGYKAKKYQIPLRFVPFFVVLVFMLIFYFIDMLTMTLIIFTVLLTSFGLAMASPKHMALHDFVAQTLVIDAKGSILFEDASDELIYLEREDARENKKTHEKEENGEEPALSYEK